MEAISATRDETPAESWATAKLLSEAFTRIAQLEQKVKELTPKPAYRAPGPSPYDASSRGLGAAISRRSGY